MASHLSDAGDTTIQCVAIDDVLYGEQINIIKMDVEGAEVETLKGMRNIIERQQPQLLISAYHAPEHLYAITELINYWKLRYKSPLYCQEYNTFGTDNLVFPVNEKHK